MSSVYIAAPYPQREEAIQLMRELEADGLTVTSTWLRELDAMTDDYARLDLADVARADCLLAFNPAGWENQGTGGRHVEYGYALGLGKPVVLLGERSHIFHHLSSVVVAERATVSASVLKALGKAPRRKPIDWALVDRIAAFLGAK